MRIDSFKDGLAKLKKIANHCKTAIMCADAVYYRCHSRMISDRLAFDGWEVFHLGMEKEPIAHQIWDIARLDKNGDIIYDE